MKFHAHRWHQITQLTQNHNLPPLMYLRWQTVNTNRSPNFHCLLNLRLSRTGRGDCQNNTDYSLRRTRVVTCSDWFAGSVAWRKIWSSLFSDMWKQGRLETGVIVRFFCVQNVESTYQIQLHPLLTVSYCYWTHLQGLEL